MHGEHQSVIPSAPSGPGLQSASDASRLSGQPLWGYCRWDSMENDGHLTGMPMIPKILVDVGFFAPESWSECGFWSPSSWLQFTCLLPEILPIHVSAMQMNGRIGVIKGTFFDLFRIFLFIDITVACPTSASPASATGELRRARHRGWFEPRGAKGHGSVRLCIISHQIE